MISIVVVLSFLPKYFWHSYHTRGKDAGKINESANKCKPRPLPPVDGQVATAETSPATLTATVKITALSQKPTNDPGTLDYDEALMHVAAVVQDGPLKGYEIGLRYWILYQGSWTKANGAISVGDQFSVDLGRWDQVIAKDATLARHQIFNDTNQGLMVPVYWVTGVSWRPSRS